MVGIQVRPGSVIQDNKGNVTISGGISSKAVASLAASGKIPHACLECGMKCGGIPDRARVEQCAARCCGRKCRELHPGTDVASKKAYTACIAEIATLTGTRGRLSGAQAVMAPESDRWSVTLLILLIALVIGMSVHCFMQRND
jgi:hypothetical protein